MHIVITWSSTVCNAILCSGAVQATALGNVEEQIRYYFCLALRPK